MSTDRELLLQQQQDEHGQQKKWEGKEKSVGVRQNQVLII
jgi:hypothetical protein